jgi:hypothetical protein
MRLHRGMPVRYAIQMAASSPQIAYNGKLKPLVDLLSDVRRPGDFYVRGSLVAPLPRLDVVGVGTISFLVPEFQAREIIRQSVTEI